MFNRIYPLLVSEYFEYITFNVLGFVGVFQYSCILYLSVDKVLTRPNYGETMIWRAGYSRQLTGSLKEKLTKRDLEIVVWTQKTRFRLGVRVL